MMIKRAFLVFTFCLAYLSGVFAQSPANDPLKNVAVFLMTNSEQVVQNKDSADFVRIIRPDTSNGFIYYIVNDFYLDGKKKMVGVSSQPSARLIRQGRFVQYYHNGYKKCIENFDNDSLSGDFTYYYTNGKLYYSGTYNENAKQASINHVCDSLGATMAEDGRGKWIIYDDDFKHIMAEGPIVNGLKEGVWHGTTADSTRYICTYNKGESVSGVSYDKFGTEYHFIKERVQPQFKDGNAAFIKFLADNLHYPKEARKKLVMGIVFVRFTVEKDGALSNFKIIRGLGSGCDEEVIRVMKASPSWYPGMEYGVPVRINYTMPIKFTM